MRELRGQHDLLDNAVFQTRNPEQARRKVAALATAGVNFIALNFVGHKGMPRLDLGVAQAIIAEAHACGLRAFARVGTEDEAWAMIPGRSRRHRAGDIPPRVSPPGSDTLLRAMSAKGVSLTPLLAGHWPLTTDHQPPTTSHQPPATSHQPLATHSVKRAYLLGVPLCAGSDFPRDNDRCGDGIFQELDRP